MLVAQGKTSKEIGRVLSLSPSTIDSHIRTAVERLGAMDRTSAARQVLAAEQKDGAIEPTHSKAGWWSLIKPPPLGGVVNELSARRRIFHVVQIALLGVMGMTAAVVTIAGLVNLFRR